MKSEGKFCNYYNIDVLFIPEALPFYANDLSEIVDNISYNTSY